MGGILAIENIHQRVPDGCAEKAPDGMRDRVPMRIPHVVAAQLSRDLAGEDMDQDHDLQPDGKLTPSLFSSSDGSRNRNSTSRQMNTFSQ